MSRQGIIFPKIATPCMPKHIRIISIILLDHSKLLSFFLSLLIVLIRNLKITITFVGASPNINFSNPGFTVMDAILFFWLQSPSNHTLGNLRTIQPQLHKQTLSPLCSVRTVCYIVDMKYLLYPSINIAKSLQYIQIYFPLSILKDIQSLSLWR